MSKDQIYMKLFSFSRPTYYKWKREKVPAIQLIQNYFNDEDLQEFLSTGRVSRLDNQMLGDDFKDLILDDHVLCNVKFKLITLSDGSFKMLEILQDALKDIDPKDNSFTLENSKQRLIDRICGMSDVFSKDVSLLIHDYFSKAEVFVLVKHLDLWEMIDAKR